jgi:hypothetical protein
MADDQINFERGGCMDTPAQSAAYEVLSPWADADPVALKGITERPKGLEGRKIGLFSNGKRAAPLVLAALERQLREKVPSIETSRYESSRANTPEILTEGRDKFEAWVGLQDTVVLAVGD